MKEMSLKDVQGVSFGILTHFHNFCIKNGLKYSLGYGSLIGAVRHKGFIPWDDDVDIVMLRDDFERLCAEYKDNDQYKLFCPQRQNIYSVCARLCEMRRTFVETQSPLFKESTGIWIDIFPLDSIPDEQAECERFKENVNCAYKNVMRRRWRMRTCTNIKGMIGKIYLLLRCPRSIMHYVNHHVKLCKQYEGVQTKRMACLSTSTYSDRDYIPKELFTDVVELPFENTSICVMNGYDEWLQIIYSDYMQLPPIGKRVQTHNFHRFYWK